MKRAKHYYSATAESETGKRIKLFKFNNNEIKNFVATNLRIVFY